MVAAGGAAATPEDIVAAAQVALTPDEAKISLERAEEQVRSEVASEG